MFLIQADNLLKQIVLLAVSLLTTAMLLDVFFPLIPSVGKWCKCIAPIFNIIIIMVIDVSIIYQVRKVFTFRGYYSFYLAWQSISAQHLWSLISGQLSLTLMLPFYWYTCLAEKQSGNFCCLVGTSCNLSYLMQAHSCPCFMLVSLLELCKVIQFHVGFDHFNKTFLTSHLHMQLTCCWENRITGEKIPPQ